MPTPLGDSVLTRELGDPLPVTVTWTHNSGDESRQ